MEIRSQAADEALKLVLNVVNKLPDDKVSVIGMFLLIADIFNLLFKNNYK